MEKYDFFNLIYTNKKHMGELIYVVEIIEPFNFEIKFGKPFYNFSIDIIKIKDNECEKEECKGLFYYG